MQVTSVFATPIEDRHFEDYVPGTVFEFGPVSVNESEILDFARRYDPQYFHTDPIKSKSGPFSGLIASGWHTAGIMMRLFVDNYMSKTAGLGSPGLEYLQWKKPVRPGDQLRIRISVVDAKRSKSRPDRGILRQTIDVLNQSDDVVMSLEITNFVLCRRML